MKAVIYTRFSSQAQNPLSCKDQEAVCRDFAESNGYQIERVYSDEAISGRTDKRPSFQQMIMDAKGSDWDAVIVYKLARFARSRVDSAVYRKQIEPVAVVSAMEHIPEDASGIILEGVLDAINEYYSYQLAENTKRGMRAGAERCEALGVPVYGYDIIDNHYVINEEEAKVVREIFQMSIEGAIPHDMLQHLIASGAKTGYYGNTPGYSFLQKMLSCPKYYGLYQWDDIVVEDGMPAIIDRATFDMAQQASHRRKSRAGRNKRADYFLYGKVYCPERHLMSGQSAKGGKYAYYTCNKCGLRIRKEKLEGMVAAMAKDALKPEYAEAIVAQLEEYEEKENRAERSEALENQLVEVEKAISNLLKAVEAGIDPNTVKDRLEELNGRREDLESSIRVLCAQRPSHELLLEAYNALRTIGEDEDVANTFVRTIVVTPDLVAVALNVDQAETCVEQVADIEKRATENGCTCDNWLPGLVVTQSAIIILATWEKSVNRFK